MVVNSYDADIPPGSTKALTVGAFTISDADLGSGCTGDTLNAQQQPASYFVAVGDAAYTGPTPPSTPTTLNPAGHYTGFSAVLTTGGSTIWGMVGNVTSGSSCITSGGAAGM